ncbi:MAG: GDYXXLXY domain-containing protein [Saprospirales bacterium]|nr:GDYXXLXY domain-containing protein [Saprospirales bacterium]
MNSRKIRLSAFILLALVQLYVPAKMILDSEGVLSSGIDYKFKTAPIDPNDPFRGKYIRLSYADNIIDIQNEADWVQDEPVYVLLTTDDDGFAKNESVSKEKPANDQPFLTAKVRYVTSDGTNKLTIDYPFDKFYMEESKAYDAELVYRESLRDTSQMTYALGSIKNGEAVLKDVLIDGISIREIAGTS